MSFSELHQKELEDMSHSVFGEEGIVERLRELRDLVMRLREQVFAFNFSKRFLSSFFRFRKLEPKM